MGDEPTGSNLLFMISRSPCYSEFHFTPAEGYTAGAQWAVTGGKQTDLEVPKQTNLLVSPRTHAYRYEFNLVWAGGPSIQHLVETPDTDMDGNPILDPVTGEQTSTMRWAVISGEEYNLRIRAAGEQYYPFRVVTTTPEGEIRVVQDDQAWPGGGPPGNLELSLQGAAVQFDDFALRAARLQFADLGGPVYLNVDGQQYRVANFSDLKGRDLNGNGTRLDVLNVPQSSHDEEGFLIILGSFDSIAIGGEDLRIDEVCFYKGDCLFAPGPVIATPGVRWTDGLFQVAPDDWDPVKRVGLRLGMALPKDQRVVRRVSVAEVTRPAGEDVTFTAQILDGGGSVIAERKTPVSSGAANPDSVDFDFGGQVELIHGQKYSFVFSHDASAPVQVPSPPITPSSMAWLDPTTMLQVEGIVSSSGPGSVPVPNILEPLLPISIELDCPSGGF